MGHQIIKFWLLCTFNLFFSFKPHKNIGKLIVFFSSLCEDFGLWREFFAANIVLEAPLRGCSYGGELTRLGGLVRLGEISPSLRNSYKNIACSYDKWASAPRWDLTWFCRDPNLGEMKIFHMNTRKWASPARWDSIFFNQFCFTFQMLIK